MTSLTITTVEKRTEPTLVIYWLGTEDNPREFGVCFSNGLVNIANQSVAESVALALGIASDMVEKL